MFSQYIFKYQPSQQPNQGFSIVEAMVSLICVTVTLFLAASLFTNQRQQNITNNQRAQAGAIAQYYFENYRNQITTAASLPALSEVIPRLPGDVRTDTGIADGNAAYGVEIRVRDVAGTTAGGAPNCVAAAVVDSPSRCIRVQVRRADFPTTPILYEQEVVFTTR